MSITEARTPELDDPTPLAENAVFGLPSGLDELKVRIDSGEEEYVAKLVPSLDKSTQVPVILEDRSQGVPATHYRREIRAFERKEDGKAVWEEVSPRTFVVSHLTKDGLKIAVIAGRDKRAEANTPESVDRS